MITLLRTEATALNLNFDITAVDAEIDQLNPDSDALTHVCRVN